MPLFRKRVNQATRQLHDAKARTTNIAHTTSAGDTRIRANARDLNRQINATRALNKSMQKRRSGLTGFVRKLFLGRMNKLRFERKENRHEKKAKLSAAQRAREELIEKLNRKMHSISRGENIVLIDTANRSHAGTLNRFKEKTDTILLDTPEGTELHYTYELKDIRPVRKRK
jgi:hypothetical protein